MSLAFVLHIREFVGHIVNQLQRKHIPIVKLLLASISIQLFKQLQGGLQTGQ
ncbi:hypothetical protein Golax_012113 [Gossypium laxum]|uniref:Uncharacterized protein n=2 Tax=Gossypium TaxID=3633 RepID=A0A7J9BUR0_GOSGO|nr:hypothetical protein [Gossypium laxum]MBA0739929.1 hypothetical protein [Gossypium gossypioides]